MIGFDIDPLIALALGALAGLILQLSKVRKLGRVIPPLALVSVAVGMVMPLPIPAPLQYALIGAGAVVSVLSIGGRS